MAQGVASAPALRQRARGAERAIGSRLPPRREPHRHTYGAIDLGTNNCRLLIARPTDGGFTVIDAFSRIVRLGEGLSRSGKLSRRGDGPRGRGAWRSAPTSCAAATSRCRARSRPRPAAAPATAANSSSGCATKPASSLDIIPPQEEARLAVLGCHKLLEPGDGPALIFDIGGGSTELVLVDQERGHAAHPRLVERAVGRRVADRERGQARRSKGPTGSSPMSACASARAAVSRVCRRCFPRSREGIRLLGTSGTVTTLASVHLALAVLRPARGRRAARADRSDAEDQRDDRRHGL